VLLIGLNIVAYISLSTIQFLGVDGLTLIDTARVNSLHDVGRIFSERMMNNSEFEGAFFRPLSVISYSVDYAIWGLNFRGYLYTNLALHILVALLVFWLVRALLPQQFLVAALSALFVSLHPLAADNLIEPAGRQDILPVLFLIAALLSFLYTRRSAGLARILLYAASLVLFAFAFLSKETGIFLPAFIFVYVLVDAWCDIRKDWRPALQRAVLIAIPYGIVTLALFVWRSIVLSGVGGYSNAYSLPARLQLTYRLITQYIAALFFPIEALERLLPLQTSIPAFIVSFVLIVLFLSGLFLHRARIRNLLQQQTRLRWLYGLLMLLTAGAILGLLAFPLFTPVFNVVLDRLVSGSADVLSQSAEARGDVLLILIRRLLLATGAAVLIAGVFGMALFNQKVRTTLFATQYRAITFLLAAWLLLPLALYVLITQFAARTWYIAIIPASIILAVIVQQLVTNARQVSQANQAYPMRLLAVGMLTLTVALPIVTFTRSYQPWAQSSTVAFAVLEELSNHIEALPQTGSIELDALPNDTELGSLSDYGVASWLALKHPGYEPRVTIKSKNPAVSCFVDVTATVRGETDERARISFDVLYDEDGC